MEIHSNSPKLYYGFNTFLAEHGGMPNRHEPPHSLNRRCVRAIRLSRSQIGCLCLLMHAIIIICQKRSISNIHWPLIFHIIASYNLCVYSYPSSGQITLPLDIPIAEIMVSESSVTFDLSPHKAIAWWKICARLFSFYPSYKIASSLDIPSWRCGWKLHNLQKDKMLITFDLEFWTHNAIVLWE